MSIFENGSKSHLEKTCFFDEPVATARFDKVRYPVFEKLTDKSLGFFWRSEEVDLTRDSKDFKTLNPHEKHIFTSNLKRQILLDSVQGRGPSLAFLPICSLPEVEAWINSWGFFENTHSRSYSHIIRNIYADPSKVFDDMLGIQEIVDCAKDISKYYDDLIYFNNHSLCDYAEYKHKRALWLCLNAVNALEGVRFYVSFACSWAFAELKKMEGNAKIIKFIARDENLHLAGTQHFLKILPKEDPDFVKIREECRPEVQDMFISVVNQEKTWAKYLMQYGSVIGLNEQILCTYIEWIAKRRLEAIGLKSPYSIASDPLPWTQKWIAGADVQVAPQETELGSYVSGGVKQDISGNTFAGFEL